MPVFTASRPLKVVRVADCEKALALDPALRFAQASLALGQALLGRDEAATKALAALGETEPGTPLSALLADYARYAPSGEINTTVADQGAVLGAIRSAYSTRPGVELDELDGLTVSGRTDAGAGWWFNVRPSNTEPLLRLNVEGADAALMESVRDEVLALIREGA